MSNVPQLRFSEFSREWEEKRLGNISNKIMYGIGSSAIQFDGTNKYLRITDIDESSRTFIPNPLTSPDGIIKEKYKLVEGDIVFARTGASVGKSYLYNHKDGNLIYAGFLIKVHIKDANPYFVYAHTFKEYYNKWVQVMSVRSGQPGINAEEYKLLPIKLPSKPEQEKIASFLSSVDTKIEQLTSKTKLLQEYKKGVMQKIFSQEIRFHPKNISSQAQGTDDDGSDKVNGEAREGTLGCYPEWVEKKLGAIAAFTKGKGISKEDIVEDGEIECIRYGELYTEYNEIIIDTTSKTNLSSDDLVFSKYNDIIIPSSGETSIDIATASCVLKDDIVLGGDLNIIRTNENGIFLAYYLNNAKKYDIAKLAQGSSVIHLYAVHLKTLKINLPSLKEQTKIANFLSSIDSKIEQVQKQLDSTKELKKALLQQMFV